VAGLRPHAEGNGRRLQVRAEGQQTAVAILHHELAAVPGHVAKSSSEFHALGGVLGIDCVGIFNEQVRVEQFVRVFIRIGCRRLGAADGCGLYLQPAKIKVRALLGARKGKSPE